MAKIRAIIFVTCLVSFQANAATLVKTGTGHIDETSSSGIGFGANKFYMSGATLVDVSLIFDATLEYDFSQNFSSPLTPIDQTPSISYSYNEYLTIDDPFGDLLAPETLSLGLFGLLINCSTTLVFFPGTPHDSTTCAASGSETFSSVPIDVTGIIPDDFTGLDIFNFSAESSFLGYVASVNNPVLTPGAQSRQFDWSLDYTLTYTYELDDVPEIPVPAAAWLFASGLLGVAGFGRRRKPKG